MAAIVTGWHNSPQLAEYLHVTEMTLWRWAKDPALAFPQPSIIRGRKYWSIEDIDQWMRAMASSAASKREAV